MVLGFDPSLTSSGFSYTDVDGKVHTGVIKPKSIRGVERLIFIRDSLASILKVQDFRLIAYEGYSMGGRNQVGRFFDIGELGGVLKSFAIERGFDILLVPPTNLKQFATERGNAKKPDITQAVASVWGYNVKQNDEADAFILMKMGEAYLSRRVCRAYSQVRRESLTKCSKIKGQSN